jgi:threonine dehydrogenase-like Zn-dependent dehydrogenase
MSSSYNGWNIALSLMASGKLKVNPMISVMTLEEWQEAFALLEAGKAMKVLLTPEK